LSTFDFRILCFIQTLKITGMKCVFSILVVLILATIGVDAFTTQSPLSSSSLSTGSPARTDGTRLYFNPMSAFKHWGKKVVASHILIGPPASVTGRGMTQDDATAKLLELKAEINDDPEKFAECAKEFSSCRTSKVGGNLGDPFGAGVMVKPIDEICFEKEVGVVHGPVSSPFGEHLVLIQERTGDE
jgi:Na+-transporting methylmalonyl-CoA/oxaloacetate decarboxylase gamma subunit